MNLPFCVLLSALAAALWTTTSAAPAPVRAVVRVDRTNLRAQPSKEAEVLASLKRGETVEVLGQETPAGQKESWSRVSLPPSVMVWAFAPGVDKAGHVKNAKLNFRAGPGKNYSVLGSLNKGDTVVIIREFDGWVQIAPPDGAVAYIASRLLTTPASFTSEQPAPATTTAPAESTPATSPVTPPAARPTSPPPFPTATASPTTPTVTPTVTPPVTRTAPVVTPTTPPPIPPPKTSPEPVPSTPIPPVVAPITARTPVSPAAEPVAAPVKESAPAEPAASPEPVSKPRPPLGSPRARIAGGLPVMPAYPVLISDPDPTRPKPGQTPPEPRHVIREGVVHRTSSIQAPTDFELRDGFYNEGVLDYLFLEPQSDLLKFLGKRVRAEGEEYLDSRWRTPVLKAQTVELVP